MQRALLVLAVLGVLAWSAAGVLSVLLPHVTPPSVSLWLARVDVSLIWAVPGLGLIVGILGAVQATRSNASGWLPFCFVLFAALSVVLPLLAVPFVGTTRYSCEIACATRYSEDQTARTVGVVAVAIAFLFPIIVFVTALVYVVRGGVRPGKA